MPDRDCPDGDPHNGLAAHRQYVGRLNVVRGVDGRGPVVSSRMYRSCTRGSARRGVGNEVVEREAGIPRLGGESLFDGLQRLSRLGVAVLRGERSGRNASDRQNLSSSRPNDRFLRDPSMCAVSYRS
jgi:hypothetical protein